MAWKSYYFTHFFERWKLKINKRNDRLQKFMEISQTFKITQNLLQLWDIYELKFKY